MFYFEASTDSVDDLVLPSNHGWHENYDYKWIEDIYPKDVTYQASHATKMNGTKLTLKLMMLIIFLRWIMKMMITADTAMQLYQREAR